MGGNGFIEKRLQEDIPQRCTQCGSTRLYYQGLGKYECKACKNVELDDYGKIRDYIDRNGDTPAAILVIDLGIPKEIVDFYVKDGALEVVVDESRINTLTCAKCGCTILSGRYCFACQKELTDGIKEMFKEKKNISGHAAVKKEQKSGARMRYLDT